MKSSRSNGQLNLPPSLLPNPSQAETVRRKSSQSSEPVESLASTLFAQAMDDAKLTTAEVAYLVQHSESLVTRWRSPEHREQPSFAQLLRLPPAFHMALHKRLDQHYGFSHAAVRDALEAIGRLAVAVGL